MSLATPVFVEGNRTAREIECEVSGKTERFAPDKPKMLGHGASAETPKADAEAYLFAER